MKDRELSGLFRPCLRGFRLQAEDATICVDTICVDTIWVASAFRRKSATYLRGLPSAV